MIFVTEPFLPDFDRYVELLKGVWERNWLTNGGPLLQELEQRLRDYCRVDELAVAANGTLALQLAIKGCGVEGEIVTTPYSYVASTSAPVWEGVRPVFADVDPATCNISPAAIEAAITARTEAILAVHVYGNPCDVEAIDRIAQKHGLAVIYDAAHAFGVRLATGSLLAAGDVSCLSFHATKLFHSVEGGALCTSDTDLARRLRRMRSFGHRTPEEFDGVGINAKMSEFHAAMGLCVLEYIDDIIESRRAASEMYDDALAGAPITKPVRDAGVRYNYSYYPVFFDSEPTVLRVKSSLEERGISTRRYFYPSLNTLHYLDRRVSCPVSEDLADRVLCLPLFAGMEEAVVDRVAGAILAAL